MKYSKNIYFKRGSSYIRFQEVKKYENIDILFTGSSHAYRGFDTRLFNNAGYSSYNLGSTAQTPLQTEYLLNQYLEELKPKIVVIEVYPKVFTIDGIESTLDLLSNNFDINGLFLTLEHSNFKVLNTFIYSRFFASFLLKKNQNNIILSSNDVYVKGGYVEREVAFNKVRKYQPITLSFVDKQFKSLQRIDKLIKKKGILPIYVIAPIDSKFYNSFLNIENMKERIKKLGTLYDFNEILTLNDTLHFFDSHHLNQNGVEIFNNELIRILNTVER
jgi:poly-D-alanine transfer protein DltD